MLGLPGVLRAKGFFWLASRPQFIASWSQAGQMLEVQPAGIWYAAIPREVWDLDDEARDELEGLWHEELGDRRQEIAIIGQGLDREGLTALLDACLLTPEEMAAGIATWATYRDPFPQWQLVEDDDEATGCGGDGDDVGNEDGSEGAGLGDGTTLSDGLTAPAADAPRAMSTPAAAPTG
jgi:hypothetical protein